MAKTSTKIPFVDRAAIYLVGQSQRPITLEAEVASDKKKKFISDYKEWTGISSNWAEVVKAGHVKDCGVGKWGIEYRVYFVKDQVLKNQLERYGCMVENGDVRYNGTFRINSRELFFELAAKHGLRLGANF